MSDDLTAWNKRYEQEEYLYGKEPTSFLKEHADLFEEGKKVLCIGEGEGRNAVFLASMGLDVTCVDFSQKAIDKAELLATEKGVSINTFRVDLTRWDWPKGAFNYVVWFFLHLPPESKIPLYKNIRDVLREKGVLIGEVFHKNQLNFKSGGPKEEAWLFEADEIEEAFMDSDVILLEERLKDLGEGHAYRGKGAVVDFILKKHSRGGDLW